MLDEAKEYYSSCIGTELSPSAAQEAKQRSAAEVYVGGVDSLPEELHSFDMVIAINVIEHIYSPVSFLLNIRKRLNSRGHILLATPNAGGLWFNLLRSRWPSLKIPEHVAFYSEKTLRKLLQTAGFTEICKISYLHAFPLGLVMQKMGIRIPARLSEMPIWIPGTMIAMVAQR